MRADSLAETLPQSPVDPTPRSSAQLDAPPTSSASAPPAGGRSMATAATLLPTSPLAIPHGTASASAPRPKLTLNTDSCPRRLLGKGGTGIRLDALSASSPTVQNTYKNSYTWSSTHASNDKSARNPSTPHPAAASPSSSNTSASERSRSSSQASAPDTSRQPAVITGEVPYSRTPNLHPILSNTPLPTKHVCTPTSAARRVRRQPNSVAFHVTLTEEIRNSRYTARHSDLLNPSPRGEKRDSSDTDDGDGEQDDDAAVSTESSESSEGTDDTTDPKTPVLGRRKRRREWKWTLGPLSAGAGRCDASSEHHEVAVAAESAPPPPRLGMPTPRRRAS